MTSNSEPKKEYAGSGLTRQLTHASLLLLCGICLSTSADPLSRGEWIKQHFGMSYLEGESGFLVLREESEFSVDFEGKSRKIHNSIYYLLTEQHPTNYLHWLAIEDIHILVDGGPVDYYLFLEDGEVRHVRLGRDYAAGEVPAVTVPARSYKAVQLADDVEHALMVNVLTPGWSPDLVNIGAPEAFFSRYENKAPWATAEFLQSLQALK